MTTPYPVAPTAEAALHAPLGEALREREAQVLAGGPVTFSTAWVGPAFATRADAEAAYAAQAASPWCELRPVAAEGATPHPPARPSNRDGVRWPSAPAAPPPRWRLSVTFWRPAAADADRDAMELEPARRLRRDTEAGAGLDARTLRRLAAQPLRPVRPQQPLDVGLFEVRLPERPDLLMPDE